MRVAVDEAWKRHFPAPIHALVVPAGWNLSQDLRGLADREDAVPCYGYRGGGVDAQRSELSAPERTRTYRGDRGREVVLVAHDASGPPAIDWALWHPERTAAPKR